MDTTTKKLEYLPGLDGIRALAALLVISTHWPNVSLSLKFGWIGVNIFFVLSGFLITRILVNEKQKPFKTYLRQFFYKRALRIFPVYFLFFFVTAALVLLAWYCVPQFSDDKGLQAGVDAIKYDTPYYLTYTYNLKLNLAPLLNLPDISNGFFGHLWSLSAEEQFYLIFPFLVYFVNVRSLKKILIAIIIICPLLRLWASLAPVGNSAFWIGETLYTNTFCQADALAAGALLAICPFNIKFRYLNFFVIAAIWLGVGLVCLYFLRQAGYFLVEGKSFGYNFPAFWLVQKTPYFMINIRAFYLYSLVNLFAVALIAPAVINRPLFPAVLCSRPMKYLGKISYGVYLFHNPLLSFFRLAGTFFGGWYKFTEPLLVQISVLALYLVVLFTLAHLSYQYFERKIMHRYKLKDAGN